MNESALKDKYGEELVDIDIRKEAVPLKLLNVGNSTKKILLPLQADLKSEVLADANKAFYINVTKYLHVTWQPVDHYWKNVLSMTDSKQLPKYKYLGILLKAILTFSHGWASVERGLYLNKRMLKSERSSLSLDTIRGLRLIKDPVGGKAAEACITKEMIQFYKDAYSKYKIQKEFEKSSKDLK